MSVKITRKIAAKVLATVDAGLISGIGLPIPGEMCVEAAVCYALGLPHGDEPNCVAPALRQFKITLNDSCWSSKQARARGLRRIALAQLGSAGVLDEKEFARRLAKWTIRNVVPRALQAVAMIIYEPHKSKLKETAQRCIDEGTQAAARAAARAMAYVVANAAALEAARAAVCAANAAALATDVADAARAAGHAARAAGQAACAADDLLSFVAEGTVQILINMDAPGCKWLDLAPLDRRLLT